MDEKKPFPTGSKLLKIGSISLLQLIFTNTADLAATLLTLSIAYSSS